jgi:polar amino acid transport system permease protein
MVSLEGQLRWRMTPGRPDAARLRDTHSRRQVLARLQAGLVLALLVYAIYAGASAMPYEWQWSRVPQFLFVVDEQGFRWGTLSIGFAQTIWISLLALLLAAAFGLLLALLRLSASWSGRAIATGVIETVRTTPLIVQISMFYFVLAPIFGIDRFWTGVLSLALFESAFIAEIIRSGLLAVPVSQWEAGTSLGLRRAQIYRHIALPQAVRIMLPPLTGAAISLIKDSAIVSVIALFELTTAGRDAISLTYMSFEIWLTVAAIYLALTFSLSVAARSFERRLKQSF